jgi:hypothetical protein
LNNFIARKGKLVANGGLLIPTIARELKKGEVRFEKSSVIVSKVIFVDPNIRGFENHRRLWMT